MDIDIRELIKAAAEGFDLSNFKGDVVGVKVVENEISNVEEGGIGIQNVFANSKPKTAKREKKAERKPNIKPKTLKYYVHGNNGVLMKQRQRVNIVYRLLNKWGWIDKETKAIDFDAFFEGEPKHCNITWKSKSTILTILLQELLKQSYIERQTGCSAKSLVTEQFGKTPNSDMKRLDDDNIRKIKLVLIILDINNPLAEEYEGKTKMDVDQQFADLCVIYEDKLRSTKGI